VSGVDAGPGARKAAVMFTILGADGKEYGPVTVEKLQRWIIEGRANLQTKVRREGEAEWKALGDFAEFSAPPAAVPPPPVAPVSPAPQAASTGSVNSKAYADTLIARAAPLDIFGCLERSFNLWKGNLLPLVGVTLLIIVVQMAAGFVPILGMLSGLLLNGVFYGGLYYYYLGIMRGEPRELGDAFAGFSKALGPLVLATLMTSLLIFAVMLPFFGSFFVTIIQAVRHGGTPPEPSPGALLALLLGVIPLVYLAVGWAFTFVLVIDKGLSPWTAMEVSRRVVTRQWFRVFFLMICAGIVAMLGLIALFVGVLFTLPLMFGAILYAYEDLFNPPGSAGS
jgi:hypothetical protein